MGRYLIIYDAGQLAPGTERGYPTREAAEREVQARALDPDEYIVVYNEFATSVIMASP
jgi:hypothetical protein